MKEAGGGRRWYVALAHVSGGVILLLFLLGYLVIIEGAGLYDGGWSKPLLSALAAFLGAALLALIWYYAGRATRLEEEVRFYRLLAGTQQDGMIVCRNRIVEWANDQAAAILGLGSSKDLIGLRLDRFYPARTNRLLEEQHYPLMREQGWWRDVYDMQRADGTPMRCRLAVVVLDDAGDRFPRVLTSIRDITHEEKQYHEIENHVRMEALGRMAGGIAHSLNSALGTIEGYLALIEERQDLDETLRRHAAALREATERASDLAGRLLKFARGTSAEMETTRPPDIVAETAESIAQLLDEPGIVFNHSCAADLPSLRCSRSEIVGTLVELCSNAIDAMPDGGALMLECDAVQVTPDNAAEYRALPPGRYIRFSVSDTGVGIPEDRLERVFEPFFSTKGRRGGGGLGLSMVYTVVQGHGGAVACQSEAGRGSVFHVYLPAAEDAPGEPAPSERTAGSVDAALVGVKVLVVEDDPILADLIEKWLEEEGALVASAGGEGEALRLLDEGLLPRLSLVDIVLPDGEGPALGARLKAGGTAVIGMGGGRSAENHGRPDEKAIDAFLRKPFNKALLVETTTKLLENLPQGI